MNGGENVENVPKEVKMAFGTRDCGVSIPGLVAFSSIFASSRISAFWGRWSEGIVRQLGKTVKGYKLVSLLRRCATLSLRAGERLHRQSMAEHDMVTSSA